MVTSGLLNDNCPHESGQFSPKPWYNYYLKILLIFLVQCTQLIFVCLYFAVWMKPEMKRLKLVKNKLVKYINNNSFRICTHRRQTYRDVQEKSHHPLPYLYFLDLQQNNQLIEIQHKFFYTPIIHNIIPPK